MATRPRVSVLIPTMNEEASIGRVLDAVHAALRDHGPYEILVVDTASRDRTVNIAKERGARVIPEPRRGYGRAYKTGFAAAQGEIIVTLDADLTYPADRIPDFLRILDTGEADFVSGERLSGLTEGAMNGMHQLGNQMLTAAFRFLYGFPIRDSQSGMWAFRRAILERFELLHDGMAFSEELKLETIWKGLRFREIPIVYRTRVGDRKIRSFRDATANMAWLFRKRFGWVPRRRGT